ncbi:serine protease [Bacteriovorax sp. Seq25_V]|uniref:trypsin-like serine peptidase n=1 Tax=Bacteriovorax sp. Seq25_V TaxID=1201288 RepID=UPI00038A4240|nr:serine protease [Bacteriovorax sp. Seq25_V]EQC46570.1 trypsin [Bacteriovorax sp. Seq25_V]
MKLLKLTFLSLLFSANSKSIAMDKMIYGEDGRFEVDSFYVYPYREMAKAVAGRVKKNIIWKRGEKYNFEYLNLKMQGLSPLMPFTTQATLTDCTGFLVADDIMVTAGHCVVDQADCEDSLWIFDFDHKVASKKSFSEKNTVGCKEIINKQEVNNEEVYIDYAILRLTRKMTDRKPLKFREQGTVEKLSSLVMIGHPLGLPMKVTKGANVWHTDEEWVFTANLDAFGGNSGSPVINESTGLVEGILVRGGEDFTDTEDGLATANICAVNNTEEICTIGEEVTRITKLGLPELLNKARNQ